MKGICFKTKLFKTVDFRLRIVWTFNALAPYFFRCFSLFPGYFCLVGTFRYVNSYWMYSSNDISFPHLHEEKCQVYSLF